MITYICHNKKDVYKRQEKDLPLSHPYGRDLGCGRGNVPELSFQTECETANPDAVL